MEEWILGLFQSLNNSDLAIVYFLLFVSAIIENLFPPIPGDTITALGAFMVGTGRLNYVYVYLATTFGSVIGFVLLFLLGKLLGREFFIKGNYRLFSSRKIVAAESWFRKYGYFIILANRFLPGIRSAISIFAGISMLSTLKVILYSLLSSSLWNLIWIHLGYTLGNNWTTVESKMRILARNYNMAIAIFVITITIIYIIYRGCKKYRGARH